MNYKELANTLKQKGLSCSKISSMISKQERDAKLDLNDARKFNELGFGKQAKLQEKISNAQKQSASGLRQLKEQVCRSI